MRGAWSRYYLGLLTDYEDRIFASIDGVEEYLTRHGVETSP